MASQSPPPGASSGERILRKAWGGWGVCEGAGFLPVGCQDLEGIWEPQIITVFGWGKRSGLCPSPTWGQPPLGAINQGPSGQGVWREVCISALREHSSCS